MDFRAPNLQLSREKKRKEKGNFSLNCKTFFIGYFGRIKFESLHLYVSLANFVSLSYPQKDKTVILTFLNSYFVLP